MLTVALKNNPTYPALIASKGDPTTLFSNTSQTDTIYITASKTTSIGNTDYMTLGPGGFVVIEPQTDLWAWSGVDNTIMEVIPGGQSFFQLLNIITKDIVIHGTQSGLFIYTGSPGLGNPPVLSAVADGTTQDPYGNAVTPVLNIGNQAGAHTGFDDKGRMYFSDSTNVIRILIDPGVVGEHVIMQFYNAFHATIMAIDATAGGIFEYQDLGSATQGNLMTADVSRNTADPVNSVTVPAGFTSFNPTVPTQYTNINGGIITCTDGTTAWTINPSVTTAHELAIGSPVGNMFFEPGSAGPPLTTPRLLMEDPISHNAEIWHPVTYLNGFTTAVAGNKLSYSLLNDGMVGLAGLISSPAHTGNVIIATLPLPYAPRNRTEFIKVWDSTSNALLFVAIDTSGNITLQISSIAAGNEIIFENQYPLFAPNAT